MGVLPLWAYNAEHIQVLRHGKVFSKSYSFVGIYFGVVVLHKPGYPSAWRAAEPLRVRVLMIAQITRGTPCCMASHPIQGVFKDRVTDYALKELLSLILCLVGLLKVLTLCGAMDRCQHLRPPF